eukprot:9489154-Pyramimonas_sp.AAC.1
MQNSITSPQSQGTASQCYEYLLDYHGNPIAQDVVNIYGLPSSSGRHNKRASHIHCGHHERARGERDGDDC